MLALRSAAHANGVSKLHGDVSRKMWQSLWPDVPVDEVPIGHVTNGVHFRSWISPEFNQLYDRYLGPNWREEPANSDVWSRRALDSCRRVVAHPRTPARASGGMGAPPGARSTHLAALRPRRRSMLPTRCSIPMP